MPNICPKLGSTRNAESIVSRARATMTPEKKERIVFLHPDLGIGGAERLVIDAAVGLQSRGHKVTLFTSHCDPTHCFEEARDGEHFLFGPL